MKYYPISLDLKDKRCVVVGGGGVAERKVKSLIACGAAVRVISPNLTRGLNKLKGGNKIVHLRRGYRRGDLKGAFLVVGATSSEALNSRIATDAKKERTLVNIVDSPAKCDFIVPASINRGNLTISISTSGASPALARFLRQKLEKDYGSEYGKFLKAMERLRHEVLEKVQDKNRRKRIFEEMVKSDAIRLIKMGHGKKAIEICRGLIYQALRVG